MRGFVCVTDWDHKRDSRALCWLNMLAWSHSLLDQASDRVIFGDVQVPGAQSESPYKELLSGWVESGLSASLSLLDGANSFASSQHLPPLSGTEPTPAPYSNPWPYRALEYIFLPHFLLYSTASSTSQSSFMLNKILLLFFCNFAIHNMLSKTLFEPYPSPLPHLFYIINEQQERRCVKLWPYCDNAWGLMGFQCKAGLKSLYLFRCAHSV